MQEYWNLVQKLKAIKIQGYIRTHRAGDTGVGKTLEDLLGVKENNIPGPNGILIELKSARKDSSSMLTLFTKSPSPNRSNSVLLQRFGYPSKKGNNRLELHTTINALALNTLKGKTGFKIDVFDDRIEIVGLAFARTSLNNFIGKGEPVTALKEVLGYWDMITLKKSFERKLPKLLYVKADCRGRGENEEFWYNEAWLLFGFDFKNFVEFLRKGKVLVDIRIGQYPDGRPHDHGTGFRVFPDDLELCFLHRERVL